MEKFVVNKTPLQMVGEYSGTLVLDECEKLITGVRFSVVSETGDTAWDKIVSDRYILTGIPKPFFEKRLGIASIKATRLAQVLNNEGADLI